MRRTKPNAGLTLIEMLTAIAVTAVLSSIVAVAYDAMLDQFRAANKQVQLLIDVQRAQRFIVGDVRRADALPDEYAAYDADASTLICTVPSGETARGATPGASVVIYTTGGRDGRSLVRRVFPDAADPATHSETVILGDIESVVFDRSLDAGGRLVRFTISSAKDRMHKDRPTVYSFVAGRGND